MPIPSLDSARVVDPVLTTVAHGYRNPQFIWNRFFPPVPVGTRAGKIMKFGKEDFALYNTRRAPGDNIRQVQSTYSSDSYSLYQDALAEKIPVEYFEEALNGAARINLRNSGPQKAMQKISLRLEYDCAQVLQNPTLYEPTNTIALSGNDRWDIYNNAASNPSQDVRAWKEAVRQQVGVYPNVAGLGATVFGAVAEHPSIQDKLKYTGRDSLTPAMLAALWELDAVYIGQSLVKDDTSDSLADIWGKNFWLCYVPGGTVSPVPENDAMREQPSFGYTYQLQGYPIAQPERYNADNNSYLYPVIAERQPVLTGMGTTGKCGAGFLATTVIN